MDAESRDSYNLNETLFVQVCQNTAREGAHSPTTAEDALRETERISIQKQLQHTDEVFEFWIWLKVCFRLKTNTDRSLWFWTAEEKKYS